MGSQVIQAQWSLNESTSSIYGIARGVLQAATSDNVQPLAILACEQFGNTLAISQETRLKIERTVLPTPEPVSLQFLKVKVGFLKHDCAVQLGSNQAGLRFLALAAALVSSLPPFRCAQALTSMLEATTTNKQYLPTTRHLTDLMSSLEGRCRLAGFADVVFGYHSIINGVARAQGLSVYEHESQVPDSKGLTTLVDVFRQMQRVGEHEIESVVVEACESAAWIAAFSKWSLETPPSVYLADGTPVASQPGSKVTIMVIETEPERFAAEEIEAGRIAGEKAIKVTKRFKIESFKDLITGSSRFNTPSYRIGFETYSGQIRDECGRHEWARKAIFAAVPLAIRLVLENIESSGWYIPGQRGLRELDRLEDRLSIQPLTARKPSPFPKIEKVFKIMSLVLGLPSDFPSEMLASAKSFWDLQEVESYFDHTSKSRDSAFSSPFGLANRDHMDKARKMQWWTKDNSMMRYGNSSPANHENIKDDPTTQSLHEFIQSLSFICHIVILLSLFDNLSDVLFVPPRYYWFQCTRESALFKKTLAILVGETQYRNIDASRVFPDVCRILLFERASTRAVIVKSSQSDCFWFSALDNPLLSTCGYLSITSRRGRIIRGHELYNEVYDKSQETLRYDEVASVEEYTLESVTHQPFSKFHFQWQMEIDQACLSASLSVMNGENIENAYKSYPSLLALDTLAYMLVVNCEHPAPSSLDQSKVSWKFRSGSGFSMYVRSDLGASAGRSIYPLGGNRELQMYCLGAIGAWPGRVTGNFSDFGVVLRQKACFDCCVKACEEYSCRHLIL
ncbi:hypothetical protein F4801DRAFT_592569 [Xylaria longipes]|nr:hypothetical protein F4801DRAFT_592569 [Xylaria longipes]